VHLKTKQTNKQKNHNTTQQNKTKNPSLQAFTTLLKSQLFPNLNNPLETF